jgi:autotransporter-associated beta strand protein
MASYTGSLRMYADSVEGANPVQKVTLTRADQFGFQSFWFQSDAGLTTLSQTLSYTGSGEVTNSKPLYIYGTSTSPTTIFSNDTSVAGTRVTFSNVVRTESAVTTNFRIATTTGPVTFSGVISNPNSGLINLTKTGSSYEATLSGANTFTGTVAVSQGTLNATTSATALGLATSTAGISVTSGATLSLGAAATYASRSLTIGGTGVSSTVGALVIANTGTSQFQSILLGSPTNYIRATSSGSINAPFTPNNNSVIFGASAGSSFVPFASLSNVFSGTGSVTYGSHSLDTGTVNADVRHTYTGNTTLAFGTTSVASAQELPGTGGPLGNKSLTAANTLLMTGGTLSYLNGNVDYSGRFSTVGGQQWRIAAGTATTFATALVGASSLRLFGGSLTLSSASSTFSGGVTLTEGTLYAGAAQSGVSGPLGITGTITFSPAGTGVLGYTAASAAFDYSSRFATTSGQSRRINANGESVTFSTAMGGDNELRLVGSAGTLTLAVANTYTQGTTLSVGTLKCGNAASLGTGGLAQANGTTLHVTATGGKLTIQGAHTNTGTGNRTIRIGA